MEWISCTDKLPEKPGIYLCILTFDEGELEEDVRSKEILPEDFPEYQHIICQFYNEEENYFHHKIFSYEVTHWMTLPLFPNTLLNK